MVLLHLGIIPTVRQAAHPHNILSDCVHNQKAITKGTGTRLRQGAPQNEWSCAQDGPQLPKSAYNTHKKCLLLFCSKWWLTHSIDVDKHGFPQSTRQNVAILHGNNHGQVLFGNLLFIISLVTFCYAESHPCSKIRIGFGLVFQDMGCVVSTVLGTTSLMAFRGGIQIDCSHCHGHTFAVGY